MKRSCFAASALLCLLASAGALAQERPVQTGPIVFLPANISAKMWTATSASFDFGLGWIATEDLTGEYQGAYDDVSRFHFHVDHMWEAFEPATPPERYSQTYEPRETVKGVSDPGGYESMRDVFGIQWLIPRSSVERFLDFRPTFELMAPNGIPQDPGLGARFFY